MQVEIETNKPQEIRKIQKTKMDWKRLRLSLKYRPDILKLILRMKKTIHKKNLLICQLKSQLKLLNKPQVTQRDSTTQSDLLIENLTGKDKSNEPNKVSVIVEENEEKGWKSENTGEKEKSIADQVKEVAQSALQQSGMVYVESAGMYYDYKTGYYYNSELGLYYHTDTGCYYYYSDEKQNFVFHSYPDRSKIATSAAFEAHERRKARKQRREMKKEDDVESLTKTLSQGKGEEPSKHKRRKISKKAEEKKKPSTKDDKVDNEMKDSKIDEEKATSNDVEIISKTEEDIFKDEQVDLKNKDAITKGENGDSTKNTEDNEQLEDGECSETESENEEKTSEKAEESDASTSTATDDESVVKHHPPCMRVIVRETKLPKLKVGSLFLVTKDGGTVGREGDHHTIIIRDTNVSRTHLDIRYDARRNTYVATDLGSKNGTILNGTRMSESQIVSEPLDVMHGSTIELGETKLLCHIHPGHDTCGHCEPGLIMDTHEKEKVAAYTRTCSVQKQHQLELARLKNKYAPQPLAIEETAYNDRAQARRETVGSSHHSEKTVTSDLDTFIAPENKGFKLLQKMGWSKGEGLGKDGQGDVEPIPLVNNEGKTGLGAPAAPPPPPKKYNALGKATIHLASRSKLLKPAKAFQNEEDSDEE